MRVPVLIVGGGVSGLAAAYHLPDKHLVIERNSVAGGLAGTTVEGGWCFDWTGHLLHLHDPETSELIKYLLGKNIQKHDRKAWIYSYGVYSRYPFQVNTYPLPGNIKQECVDGLIEAHEKLKQSYDPKQSFAEWSVSTFGMGFSKHFFFPYNRKLWQTDPVDMTAEWVGQFVPRPSIEDVKRGASEDYKAEFGYNASFYYPKRGGMQNLVNGFLKKGKINIQYNTSLHSINCEKHVATVKTTSPNSSKTVTRTIEFDTLINTIPLPELIKRLEDFPDNYKKQALSACKWTTLVCVNIGVNDSSIGDGRHWVYFPEAKYPFYRVGFPHNFSSTVAPKGHGSMYIEVAFPGGSKFSNPEMSEIVFKCTDALKECKIIKSTEQIVTIKPLVIPYAYVIYDHNRTQFVKGFMEDFENLGMYTTGRYGGWRYSFLEKDIQDSIALARRLLVKER